MHMENYPYTLTQMQPISTTTLFGLLTVIQYIVVKRFSNTVPKLGKRSVYNSSFPISNTVQPTPMFSLPVGWYHFPKIKFLLLGVLFTAANFMIFSGSRGNYIPGPLSVLIQQSVVPVGFILSWIFMKKRFSPLHYIGGVVILVGIFVSLWPKLRDMETSNDRLWAALLIFGSTIFTAGALTFIEKFLKHDNMPFLYAWTWINLFEIIVTFPLIFAVIPVQGIPFSHMFENVRHGYNCLWRGINYSHGDECSDIGFWFLAFVIVLVANKINMTYILRHGNAVLGMVSLTCAVPLANVCFTSKRIMGKGGDVHLSIYDISGIVLVCLGLTLYRIPKHSEHNTELDEFDDIDE